MATNQEKREVVNSTKGFSSSLFLHSMLILIGISPLATFNAPIWEEEQPGMEVALGFPDEGQGNDEPTPGNNEPGGLPPSSSNTTASQTSSPLPTTTSPTPTSSKHEAMVTNDNAEAVDVAAANEAKRRKAEQEQIEAEQRRKAELLAEANRKAEAEKRRGSKQSMRHLRVNTGAYLKVPEQEEETQESQEIKAIPRVIQMPRIWKVSIPAEKEGLGGLGNRGVLSEPKIVDNSSKEGRVIIKVCVNSEGTVTSAEFTLKGSSTQDATLVNIARRNALKFKFTPSDVSQQCGTITYDFRLE